MLELLQDVMVSTGQEKLNEAQDVVTKLESEVKQLKKKDVELKELINCQDNIYFLKVRLWFNQVDHKTIRSLLKPLVEDHWFNQFWGHVGFNKTNVSWLRKIQKTKRPHA